MGNKQSCCVYPNNDHRRKQTEEKYQYEYTPTPGTDEPKPVSVKEASATNLQHISEREPEECDGDPSIHPTTSTIFLERSKSEVHRNHRVRRRSYYDNHYHHYNAFGRVTKKYSSCSTIFIDDSTVSQPNLRNTIKAVALAIYFHIRNRERSPPAEMRMMEIFDEKYHPLSKDPVPDDYAQRDPEHKMIYRFIRTLFNAAQLTAECAIVTLVYLERLLTYTEIEIIASNWKRIVLGAILLASKVWDDQAVWNVDYCQILKDIPVEEMNELERQFLEMLQFNINVPSSVYAKYYFDLRAMADAHDLSFPLEPLSKERAIKLEAMSKSGDENVPAQKLRRAHSLEDLMSLNRHSKAILS